MNKLNNKELLELLKTDVKTFNLYREEYADQEIDFSNANISWANLTGANLCNANLTGAFIFNSNIRLANLHNANILGANLQDSYLSGANVEGATITLTRENIEAIKGAIL
jgi:uncharacterized protein YjbI with pentapeptide repeats